MSVKDYNMKYCGNPLMKECGECSLYGAECDGRHKTNLSGRPR